MSKESRSLIKKWASLRLAAAVMTFFALMSMNVLSSVEICADDILNVVSKDSEGWDAPSPEGGNVIIVGYDSSDVILIPTAPKESSGEIESIEIEDYAEIAAIQFAYKDDVHSHKSGYKPSEADVFTFFDNGFEYGYESGEGAEFAMLYLDITNLSTKPKNFLENCYAVVRFKDKYDYEGQWLQFNYDIKNEYVDDPSSEVAIHPDDVFEIKPMYTGHYAIMCELPNTIVESKDDLYIEITIDDYALKYVIRQ